MIKVCMCSGVFYKKTAGLTNLFTGIRVIYITRSAGCVLILAMYGSFESGIPQYNAATTFSLNKLLRSKTKNNIGHIKIRSVKVEYFDRDVMPFIICI